jgi:hypothetical protein
LGAKKPVPTTVRRIIMNWRNAPNDSYDDWIGLFPEDPISAANPTTSFIIRGETNGYHK